MVSGFFKNVLMGTVCALTLIVANAQEVRTELTPSETMPESQSQREAVNAYLQKQDYSPARVKAVQQLANALEGAVRVDTRDEAALMSSDVELQTAIHCLFSKFNRVERAATVGNKVESLTVYTPDRVAGYLRYQKAMDGKVGATHVDSACQ